MSDRPSAVSSVVVAFELLGGRGAAGGAAATAARAAGRAVRGSAGLGAVGVRGDGQLGVEVLRGVVRLGGVGDSRAERLVDQVPAGDVFPVDERDRDTGGAGPAGAADAVRVGVGVLGAVVVDDVRHT